MGLSVQSCIALIVVFQFVVFFLLASPSFHGVLLYIFYSIS